METYHKIGYLLKMLHFLKHYNNILDCIWTNWQFIEIKNRDLRSNKLFI